MTSAHTSKVSDQYGLLIDPNLGIYADKSALSEEQKDIYLRRHYAKEQNWTRLDLLPYESFKFQHYLTLTEYYLNSQRQKV